MQKIKTDHWGLHEIDGVKFFLEPDKKDDLCPLIGPKDLPCPHRGLNENTYKKWEKFAYIIDNTLSVNSCMKMIPEGLEIDSGLTFMHAKYPYNKPKLMKLLRLTNALPFFIYGISPSVNMDELILLTKMCPERPIYFCGSSDMPVPSFIKKIGGKKCQG